MLTTYCNTARSKQKFATKYLRETAAMSLFFIFIEKPISNSPLTNTARSRTPCRLTQQGVRLRAH